MQAWQSDILDSEFLVDLVDARTEGPRFKTFVTYSLVSTLCPGGVRRRFSDFEWLRDLLKFRFHGAPLLLCSLACEQRDSALPCAQALLYRCFQKRK